MDGFESKVLNFIRENDMISCNDKVIVGFSGGADSTALLTVLYELRNVLDIELIAVHVNHNIRKEAGEDAAFADDFCKERGIEFHLVSENVPEIAISNRLTEEEAGRQVRYRAFSDIMMEKKASKIAVAHHQNDAAETFLLNLFRGTGVHGGSSIRPVRGDVIRPLLSVSRDEIEKYLEEKGISYCTDATNNENFHTRNKIRNKVLPYVSEEINAGTLRHIFRATREFAQADDYIYAQAQKIFDKSVEMRDGIITAGLDKLFDEPEIIKKYFILICFEKLTPNRKDITSAHIDSVLELMGGSNGTASIDLPYGLIAERTYSSFSLKKRYDKQRKSAGDFYKITDFSVGKDYDIYIPALGIVNVSVMEYDSTMVIPSGTYTKWFDCDRIQEVIFRHRDPNDYICIEQAGDIHKKKLSKFMTDEKIPVKERDNIYIMAEGNHCMWIPGHRISGSYKVSNSTQTILAISIN